ncbi:ATP-binding protein [Candidatus Woesearchaeota archaeon]|nr:ATP-binding protein [Candidatus Woesearchaeota archaeon]
MDKGLIIGGEFGDIIVREKRGARIELGELLVSDTEQGKILLQAYNLVFGSQLSTQSLELISGLRLEEGNEQPFFDEHLRNYNIARVKTMLLIEKGKAVACKSLPLFFSAIREVEPSDITFLTRPTHPLFLGNLRSGSRVLDLPIYLDGEKALSHHILIPATTGKGKSNLCSVILWSTLTEGYCGTLVLDPHDEYYGRNNKGLKDHPQAAMRLVYYTTRSPPPGTRSLKVHTSLLRPSHFHGVVEWTDAQRDFLVSYHRHYGDEWVSAILSERPIQHQFHENTQAVVRRRLSILLGIEKSSSGLVCRGIFDDTIGLSTVTDIVNELEKAHTVIVDTSMFEGSVELLVGSLLAHEVFERYRRYLGKGDLEHRPVISILLEEAARVLGREQLQGSSNIFSTLAREGRKFKVGLIAVTQLPSLIPRDILANMNTKIILGVEMKPERQALIESAAQDLSSDDRQIASLDRGEAILTSNFARFATPLAIPLFETIIPHAASRPTTPLALGSLTKPFL